MVLNNSEEIQDFKKEIAMLKESLKNAQEEIQRLKAINQMDDEHFQEVIEYYQKENYDLQLKIIGIKLQKRSSSYP